MKNVALNEPTKLAGQIVAGYASKKHRLTTSHADHYSHSLLDAEVNCCISENVWGSITTILIAALNKFDYFNYIFVRMVRKS